MSNKLLIELRHEPEDFDTKETNTAKHAFDLLTMEEERVLLEALSSNHKFTETSNPSK
jgi:hypothetical protein